MSVKVSLVSLPAVFLVGLALGFLLSRGPRFLAVPISYALQLAMILPPSVLGLYLLTALGSAPWGIGRKLLFSYHACVLAAFVSALPIMVQFSRAAFMGIPASLEEAAMVLGRQRWEVFFKVLLPIARPKLILGIAMAGVRAMGDFGLTLTIAGNIPGRTQTLPLYVFSRAEVLDMRGAHLASLVLLLLGLASVLMLSRLEGEKRELHP